MLIFRAWATCGLRRVCLLVFLRAGEAKHRRIIGRGQSLRLREPHNASRDTHNKMEMHTLSPPKSRMPERPIFLSLISIFPLLIDGRWGVYAKANWKSTPLRLLPSHLLLIACSEQSLSKSKSLQKECARSRCVQGELLDSVRTQET